MANILCVYIYILNCDAHRVPFIQREQNDKTLRRKIETEFVDICIQPSNSLQSTSSLLTRILHRI